MKIVNGEIVEETQADLDQKAVDSIPPVATESDIKKEAGRRILSVYPYSKQNNMSARQGELLRIETGAMRDSNGDLIEARALTTGEIAELIAIKAAWDWIVSVRSASNVIEANPPDINILNTDSRWPPAP